MKILHVSAVGFTIKQLMLPKIDYLQSRHLTVEIVCSPGKATDEVQQQGYTVHPVSIGRRIEPGSNLKSIYLLTKLMRQHQYDLVHLHTPIASVLGRIAAKLAGIKRVIYTAHGFPFHDQSSPAQYQAYFTIEKLSALITDLILVQSYEDWKTAQESGLCSAEKVLYLGNGVDIERFSRASLIEEHQSALRQALGIPPQANLIVGTIGRLTRKKGSGYLIEAAAQLLPKFPGLHILVIGGQLSSDPEPFQEQLLERIHQLGIEQHVTLTGYRNDIPELLGLLDIFTLPTFTHEGLPRSILEAMAMGLPVVTTNIRGCREAVIDNYTGLIVPPQDAQALTNALNKLLEDAQLRQKFGTASRQRVEAEYDERMVFERLAHSYAQLGILPQ